MRWKARDNMDWVNFNSFSGQVCRRRLMLSLEEQIVFPRLMKPIVRVCTMRVYRAGHRHNLAIKRIASNLRHCSELSLEWRRKGIHCVKNGSQESNSGSIRLSFCIWDKGLPDSPGSSTKPSPDFPLLPRPLKTASAKGG